MMSSDPAPVIISISSHVARGSVGNRASSFAFETLGFPTWTVPTIILPFHPGHGMATRIETDARQFAGLLDDLVNSPWTGEIAAIMTGYIANLGQIEATCEIVGKFRKINPNLLYLCDPVIGDENGLYVPEKIAIGIRDHLLPLASVATPNVHELGWLAGTADLADFCAIRGAAAQLANGMHELIDSNPAIVVATSTPAMMRGNIGTLLVHDQKVVLAENKRLQGPRNGAGDLFSALFLAALLQNRTPEQALQRATASVFEVMVAAVNRNDSELTPQLAARSLVRPVTMVTMRNIPAASRSGR